MGDGGLRQELQGRIVVDIAISDDATVAVRCVLAQAHGGDHDEGRTGVLPFANPALSTAGSGDVLAGTISGALSQGRAPFEAAVLGGYLHGLAGELARQEIGDAGVMAGDLLARLPEAMRRLRSA